MSLDNYRQEAKKKFKKFAKNNKNRKSQQKKILDEYNLKFTNLTRKDSLDPGNHKIIYDEKEKNKKLNDYCKKHNLQPCTQSNMNYHWNKNNKKKRSTKKLLRPRRPPKYPHRRLMTIGDLERKNMIRLEDLEKRIQQLESKMGIEKLINIGGKSRKRRKSRKNSKRRKSRKSRKRRY